MLVLAVLLLTEAFGASDRLCAEDTVVVQLPNSRARQTVRGTIVEYSGSRLRIRSAVSNKVFVFTDDQLVDVETALTRSHIQGTAALRSGDALSAESLFQAALASESRAWVQRDLLAMLIRCDLRRGRRASAAERFIQLTKDDPNTRHFGLIPLIWQHRTIDAGWSRSARVWLASRQLEARILGASFLLDDPGTQTLAVAELRELATCGRAQLQHLARVQLWRLKLRDHEPHRAEASGLAKRIELMSPAIRGGPWFVLGRAWSQLDEHDRAAAAYLQVPIVYSDDHHLAARACLEAAHALQAAGRDHQAERISAEITRRFGDTPFAGEARNRL